jgi:FAD:protein FMN transferase
VLAGARAVLSPPEPCGRWRDVRLEGDVVTVPMGAGLDLGGLAKGWTVDRAAEGALDAGLEWAVVNAGGDLRIAGASPVIDVAVEDPEARDAEILRLGLEAGALATSSITRRSWGPHRHHLIDPSTGRPADTGVLQATVLAPTCAEAEVRSKDALLAGDDALSRTTGILVMQDGTIVTNLGPTTEVAA